MTAVLYAQTGREESRPAAPQKSRGDYLTLKIAVMGPGDELYFWWGHIALVIEDELSGQERFYDYGLFSFDNDNFFLNFALGRLLYSCGVSPAGLNYEEYRETNRDITLYTLDLSSGEKEKVLRFAETNVLPENRNYYYHHFKDNCSTRIRDIVDLATDGRFKAAFGGAPGRFTLRQHVRRHTWFSPFFDWLLNFLMGQDIDTPITVWEEMFLPSELGNRISGFRYTDSFGNERKLVSDTEILNTAVARAPVLDAPRKQWKYELVLGMAIALALAVVLCLKKTRPLFSRIAWGISNAVLGFFFGVSGLLLLFMTFFTNHDYTYHNVNLIFANPLLFLAVPFGIILARGKGKKHGEEESADPAAARAKKVLAILWTYVCLGVICTMIIKLFPPFYQKNEVSQALVLPFACVLSIFPALIFRFFRKTFPRVFH